MVKSKKAQSTGFAWVYGLVMLFGIGVMFITFDQVFMGHLVPTIKNMVNGTTSGIAIDAGVQAEINSNIDKYMDYWHAIPFLLFFVVIIFWIISAIRKEREGEYY